MPCLCTPFSLEGDWRRSVRVPPESRSSERKEEPLPTIIKTLIQICSQNAYGAAVPFSGTAVAGLTDALEKYFRIHDCPNTELFETFHFDDVIWNCDDLLSDQIFRLYRSTL